MTKKEQLVTIKSKPVGNTKARERKVPVKQAVALLSMQKASWELNDKSYEFKDGDIIKRAGSGTS